jgi:hypothetical protein
MLTVALRLVLPVLLVATIPAYASVREGPACELGNLPGEDKHGNHWRDPPANCSRYRFVEITRVVGQAPGLVNVPDPTCGKELNTSSDAAKVAGLVVTYYSSDPALGMLVTDLADQIALGKGFAQWARDNNTPLPKALENLFYQKTKQGSCTSLVATLPWTATVVETRLLVDSIRAGPSICVVGIDCPTSVAKFLRTPEHTRSKGRLHLYHTDFMNWSHDTSQAGRMIVIYELPRGSKPTVTAIPEKTRKRVSAKRT